MSREGQCQGTGEESPSISLTFNLKEKCSFHPGHVTLDPLFILSRVFEGLWEFTHSVSMFCRLDYIPWSVLWRLLWEYGVSGPPLQAECESSVCTASNTSDAFCRQS